MNTQTKSRRAILQDAACALLAVAGLPQAAAAGEAMALNPASETVIRRYYAAWEVDDWRPLGLLLTNDFTFSSAAGDDHISKSAFKAQCWETQKNFIARFDLQRVFGSGNEAFVMYLCHTRNAKRFRNVEYLKLRGGKIQAIECYFGAQSSFPSAVSADRG